MRFNPNYVTKCGTFEVSINIDSLTPEKPNPTGYYQNDEITIHKIVVYNTSTNKMSEKSIYFNKDKGYYFKGNHSYWNKSPFNKYYISELLEVKWWQNLEKEVLNEIIN